MINLKETVEGAEAILVKHWGDEDAPTHVMASAYAEAYGYLKQGVVIHLEEQPERDEAPRAAHSTTAWPPFCDSCSARLTEPGAVVITPPTATGLRRKLHLCVSCFEGMFRGLA